MALKKNNPGCNCCGSSFVCSDCNAVTFFTISGLSNNGCTGCPSLNGTYVFRTAGTSSGGTDCRWNNFSWGSSCAFTFPIFIANNSLVCGPSASTWGITFATDPGGVKVSVALSLAYQVRDFGVSDDASRYTATWSGVFPTCADAIGQTLALEFSNSVVCRGSDPGDLCNLHGASVAIG